MHLGQKIFKYILKTSSWFQHSFYNTPQDLSEELGWLWKCSGNTWSSVQAHFTHHLLAAGLCCVEKNMQALLVVKSGCSSLLAMRNGHGWSMYLNSLYLCSAYRKLYPSFFCCSTCQWWLIFPLSFLHCLQSSYLWAFFCLSPCWMVLSPSLQGKVLIHLKLKQLPRQDLQRTVHVCFGTVVKCPYFASSFEK